MATIAQKYRVNFQQQSDLSPAVNRALGQQFANCDEMFETLFTELRRLNTLIAQLDEQVTDVKKRSGVFEYVFSAATSAPPSADQIRFDVGAPYTAITKIWLRNINADGEDIFHLIRTLPVGAHLIVQDKNDHTQYVIVAVTGAPIDNTVYFEIPVSHLEHGSALNGGQPVLVQVLIT